jgi:transketolase
MKTTKVKTMRDAIIEEISNQMEDDGKIFFLTADMGAPTLDKLRQRHPDRFINVGIAEQNLVNVCTGLALEGFTVYGYAIAAFLSMRAYEQIRNNLALLGDHKELNVNLLGIGAGVSYDMSGPSHHCLEDISIIRTLPNISFFSPSDWVMAHRFVEHSMRFKRSKYIRLDSKALPNIYEEKNQFDWKVGFVELKKGKDVCIISTGITTHKSLQIINELSKENINAGLIDLFMLKTFDKELLLKILSNYKMVVTIEEGFIDKGGLDSIIANLKVYNQANFKLKNFGFSDSYIFQQGNREFLSERHGFGVNDIIKGIKNNQ